MTTQVPGLLVAKTKGQTSSGGNAHNRVEFRADDEFMERLAKQADRLSLSRSAYIRQAVTRAVEQDEAEDPELTDK
jgi:predicted DNA-binding protein